MSRRTARRPKSHAAPSRATPGLAARRFAAALLAGVLHRRQTLSDQLDALARDPAWGPLDERERALARMIALTSLRRLGQLRALLADIYPRGLPQRAGPLRDIVLTAMAQLLFMEVPAHAAVDLAVRLARADERARHYAPLVNAGLRTVARDGARMAQAQDEARLNAPDWLWDAWSTAYGGEAARAIALAHLNEAPLDLTVKAAPADWAARLGGAVMANGSVRLVHRGRIDALDGYDEGAWWVQDMAASLPARLFGDVHGKQVIDLCAAPGGKTAQLAVAGARVTALDRSAGRLERVGANLARLGLDAALIEADAGRWLPAEAADAVLLDAPCSATGTIRRHPDVAWLKTPADVTALAALQDRLLDNAARMLKPGGLLIYCTCSLHPAEGEERIATLLARHGRLARRPIAAEEIGGLAECITPAGDLRTLPFMPRDGDTPGMDGFYAARLVLAAP